MKLNIVTTIAACAALALSLSACVSPGLQDLAAAKSAGAASTDPVAAQARLDALKEVNRHVELCHRTYTLGWPFSGIVDCPAKTDGPPALTAADVGAIVAKAIADLKAQLTPTSP